MKIFRKLCSLPDVVREEEETSVVDTKHDETILEVVWMAEVKEHMCLVWRSLVTLVTILLWWCELSYRQHHGNPRFCKVVIGFVGEQCNCFKVGGSHSKSKIFNKKTGLGERSHWKVQPALELLSSVNRSDRLTRQMWWPHFSQALTFK